MNNPLNNLSNNHSNKYYGVSSSLWACMNNHKEEVEVTLQTKHLEKAEALAFDMQEALLHTYTSPEKMSDSK